MSRECYVTCEIPNIRVVLLEHPVAGGDLGFMEHANTYRPRMRRDSDSVLFA